MLKPIKTLNTISMAEMCKTAEIHVKNAPNEDWKHNGKLVYPTSSQSVPVKTYSIKSFEYVVLTTANVAYFQFGKPHIDDFSKDYPFLGFTLAVITIDGKTYSEAHPVIGQLNDDDFRQAANGFANRFCPNCHSFDSVKQKSRRSGPECVHITYSCKKCEYVDHDCLD